MLVFFQFGNLAVDQEDTSLKKLPIILKPHVSYDIESPVILSSSLGKIFYNLQVPYVRSQSDKYRE